MEEYTRSPIGHRDSPSVENQFNLNINNNYNMHNHKENGLPASHKYVYKREYTHHNVSVPTSSDQDSQAYLYSKMTLPHTLINGIKVSRRPTWQPVKKPNAVKSKSDMRCHDRSSPPFYINSRRSNCNIVTNNPNLTKKEKKIRKRLNIEKSKAKKLTEQNKTKKKTKTETKLSKSNTVFMCKCGTPFFIVLLLMYIIGKLATFMA